MKCRMMDFVSYIFRSYIKHENKKIVIFANL